MMGEEALETSDCCRNEAGRLVKLHVGSKGD
jgi:hypothetical protein